VQYPNLFKPLKIGKVEIKNRVAMAPMNVHFSDFGGYVSDLDKCYYGARAKNEVGLICFGCVLSSRRAADQQDLMIHHLYESTHMGGMHDIAEALHTWGAKVFIQLSPGFGRQQRHNRQPYWAPSPVTMDPKLLSSSKPKALQNWAGLGPKSNITGPPREMTKEDIKQDAEDFVRAADMAISAGFDGIEVHSPHGYLFHQFFSPRSNKRTDEYGGSFENRTRYFAEIMQALKKAFGNSVPIMPRLNGNDHIDGGLTAEECRQICKLAEDLGADAIHLSNGCFEAFTYMIPDKENTALIEDQGKKLKQVIKIPIITPSIHDPELADKLIGEGETDMVSLGRQLLADPEWAKKAKEGKASEIVRCDRDFFCFVSLFQEGRIRCIKNPNLGREHFMPEYWPQRTIAKVPETLKRLYKKE
jgi:2,4-dienoyl-CoA reductase-like NADH-dependent reductase (Old Yellow Enzyme family)